MHNERDNFEQIIAASEKKTYVLRLYVAGTTPQSLRAIANIKKICEEKLPNRYELVVIDIYRDPDSVDQDQVVAAPTLVKRLPLPLRRLVGDMSDHERVLTGLGMSGEL